MPNIMRDGEIVEISQEELDAMLVDTTDYAAHWRGYRDTLLAETDWWGMADRTMTQAETDYRQALRDVPQQEGFPVNITWPTKPE